MVVQKIRAWHKPMQRMSEVFAISFERQKVKIRDLTVPFADVTLMQSTGLFDKNGKEIFEGDIVEWEHKDTGQLVKGVVKYDTEFGFWGMTDARFNDLRAIGYLANQRVTVLGNIYENQELLEE